MGRFERWLNAKLIEMLAARAMKIVPVAPEAETQYENQLPIWFRKDIVERIYEAGDKLDVDPSMWLQNVIEEALLRPRLAYGAFEGAEGPIDDLYLAIVHMEDREDLLLWRVLTEMGEQMIPVFARTEEGVQRWLEMMGFEIGAMDGPELSFRHFPAGDHFTWLRRNTDASIPDAPPEWMGGDE